MAKEQLDELKASTLKSYETKAGKEASTSARKALSGAPGSVRGKAKKDKLWNTFLKRTHGMVQAQDRQRGEYFTKTPATMPTPSSAEGLGSHRRKYHAEETEQLDELKKETLKSYVSKAGEESKESIRKGLSGARGSVRGKAKKDKLIGTFLKRTHGMTQAQDRLKGQMQVKNPKPVPYPGPGITSKKYHAEEAEQLDELKASTLRSYTKGAAPEVWDAGWQTGAAYGRGDRRGMEAPGRKAQKRTEGILKAQERLGGEYHSKVQSKQNTAAKYPAYNKLKYRAEEVEMSENEEQYIQEPITEISDLVVHAMDQKPLDFQQSFADLMQQRIADSVYEKKLEIAAGFAGANTEHSAEYDDEEVEEDDDWDGTEYEPEEDLEPGEPEEE